MSGPADGAPAADAAGPDFLRAAVRRDVDAGRYGGRVRTRFPPEPSGYLHIGHVKAICINFGVADEFGGVCALRYDDTNPEREDTHYVEQIKTDIRWLGFDWGEREHYASDYFERLYELAVQLIEAGKAYSRPPDRAADHRSTAASRSPPAATAPTASARWPRTWTCSGACAQAYSRRAPACCAPGSTWRLPTSTCATR